MDEQDLIPRIGTFFIIIGVGSIFLFIVSDIAESVYFDYLFVGLLLSGIGIYMRRDVDKPPSSGRFEFLKKMRAGELGKKKEDKKEEE